MNDEEKKAVEILNTFELRRKTKNYKEISLEDSQSVEIVLNLIEKQQKEIEKLLKAYKQDEKIIQEMAEFIYGNDTIFYLPKDVNTKQEVIDYFRKRCKQ